MLYIFLKSVQKILSLRKNAHDCIPLGGFRIPSAFAIVSSSNTGKSRKRRKIT